MRRQFKNDLGREVQQWVSDGIVSDAQAQDICARYGLGYPPVHGNRMSGYNVLVALGYLFVGLALITLIGANWDDIPRALRMASLVALTAGTQSFGLKLFLNGKAESAQRIFFLGNLFFGASIVLIAQIYHLGEHMADGVLWWALGTLPFALLVPTLLLGLQTFALALIWFWMEMSAGFYPALFPLFIAGSAFVLWRVDSSRWLFLATLLSAVIHIEYSLALWWSVDGRPEVSVEHIMISIALCLLAYSASHALLKRASERAQLYGDCLAQWSLRVLLLFLFVMSFAPPWEELLRAEFNHITLMGLVLLPCWAATAYLGQQTGQTRPIALLIAMNALVLIIALAVEPGAALALQIIDNLALIGIGVWLILRGVRDGTSRYFFLGISIILTTALCRYFNLIGDYVGGAVLFIVFAAVMLGAAKYWRHHQELANRSGDAR